MHSGRRRYSRGEALLLPLKTEPLREAVTVSIISQAGALVGKIRTDVQRTVVHSLSFTDLEGSSQELSLKLTSLPDFPILPFSIISVSIADSDFPWYAGEIIYPSSQGTPQRRQLYEYKARGLVRYLDQWKAEGIYTQGQDIGAIVDNIAQNHLQNRGAIKYNASKINTSTSILNINDIDIGKHPLKKILSTFADMTDHAWGVDASRDFFFLPKENRTLKTYFVGYQIQDFNTIENSSDVRNVITVQRDQGKGSGGAGWVVAGIFNNVTSVKKYGRKELNYQVPGFFSDEDCRIIGNGLLAKLSEPQLGAKTKTIKINSKDDFLWRGVYRFVLPYSTYTLSYSEVDSVNDWQSQISGDLVISKDNENFIYADGSIKLSFQNAQNDRIYLEKIFNQGKINKIQFYLQSNLIGSYLSCGFGLADIAEHTFVIDIATRNQFIPIEIDLSTLNIREIRKFGFTVNQNTESQVSLQIDKIDFNVSGHKTYTLQYKKAVYTFDTRRQIASVEFGVVQKHLENYVEGLLSTASELRYTSEVRK